MAPPPAKCAYCGISSQNGIVYVESVKSWFCNGQNKQATRSHAVEHLRRAFGKRVCVLHGCRWTQFVSKRIECAVCQSSNVFNLGISKLAGHSRFSFLCRLPCAMQEQARNNWRPIIDSESGFCREIAMPFQLPEANDVPKEKINEVERKWLPPIPVDSIVSPVDAGPLPEQKPLTYPDRETYAQVNRALVSAEQTAADKELNRRAREVNVTVTWLTPINGDSSIIKVRFKLREMTLGHKLNAGQPIIISLRGWNTQATIVSVLPGDNFTAQLKTTPKTPINKTNGFTIAWATNNVPYQRMLNALTVVGETSQCQQVMNAIIGKTSELVNLACPRVNAVPGLPPLNDGQKDAIDSALKNVLSVIEAPPGTGKTTVAAAIAYSLAVNGRGPVLLCAPSNIAVDKVASALVQTGLKSVLRLYARWKEDDPDYQAEDPKVDAIAVHRLVTGTRRSAKSGQINLLKTANVVCCTCITAGDARLEKIGFKSMIIDECTQANEPECMVPINQGNIQQVVLIGDRKQLGPIVKSRKAKKAKFDNSLFERMSEIQGHVALNVQYRMHPAISAFPSAKFYNGSLQDGVTAVDKTLFVDEAMRIFPNRKQPVVFIGTRGGEATFRREEISGAATSFLNHPECLLIFDIIDRLVFEIRLEPNQIGIITMYEGQRQYLASYLAAHDDDDGAGYGEIEVSTVDGYQGREKDVIIISCVRSNEKRNIGFLADNRRVNVALTRARGGLIILGDTQTLEKSLTWKELIKHCQNQGTFRRALPQ